MNGSTLFCNGIGCSLKNHCHRFCDGLSIDPHAPGYSWMPCCDEEERNGFITMKLN